MLPVTVTGKQSLEISKRMGGGHVSLELYKQGSGHVWHLAVVYSFLI